MRAHETQITVDGDYFALSNEIGQRILGTEYYTQLAGPRGPRRGPRDALRARPVRPLRSVACRIMGTSQGSAAGRRTAGAHHGRRLPGAVRARRPPGPDRQLPVRPDARAADRDRARRDHLRHVRRLRLGGRHVHRGRCCPPSAGSSPSFVLAMPRPNGSVIITATAAGEWYLYGGALGCAAGAVDRVLHRGL